MVAGRRFPMTVGSVGEARRFITEVLARCDEGVVTVARLLTSELATNALIHAHTSFDVLISEQEGVIRVAVTDESSEMPAVLSLSRSAQSGRGLLLLKELSEDWGVTENRPGKTVWFDLLCEAD
jgi:anti-sigma regulatory factor (Ser/Thr protein kinase)